MTRPRLSALPIRLRLVAGFTAAMLVLLTAAGAFVYWRVQYALDRSLDADLVSAASVIGPLVDDAGTLRDQAPAEATGVAWQVVDAQGTVLARGGGAPARRFVPPAELGEAVTKGNAIDLGSFLPSSATPYRVRVSPIPGAEQRFLVVGVRRDHRDEALRELLGQLLLAGVGALLVASGVGYLFARAALRPVEQYRSRAAEIAQGATGLRLDVPSGRDDEVTRLGETLNGMLTALEAALERERQFVTDAGHELRTPLTLLSSRIQLARRRERSVAEHELALDELAIDVARLADLAEQLLSSTLADPPSEPADLVAELRRAVTAWGDARPDRVDELTVTAPAASILVPLAPRAVERIVTNLVHNAFSHGAAPISVVVVRSVGHAVLRVTDAGQGMSDELLRKATERFRRSAQARSGPGSGLGLAIVEQLVIAAGGELRLCHAGNHVCSGTPSGVACDHSAAMTVTVLLPLSPASPAPGRDSG